MRILKIISPAIILSIILASPAFAAELELKFGHVGKPGSLFEASVNEFAKRANAKLCCLLDKQQEIQPILYHPGNKLGIRQ